MSNAFVPEGVKVLSISELTHRVKGAIEEALPAVWVCGEVSNLKKATSGHWYLTLKDAGSQLNTVIYKGVNLRLRYDLRDGMKVIANGRIIVYEPRGEYQLQVDRLQPEGIGELDLALRQLREKLSQLGYFDQRRKRPLPRFPKRVVLMSSADGAAVRDMLQTIAERWPHVEVWVCNVRVQGEGAAEGMAKAVVGLNQLGGIDVIVIGRGGGSLEDLWEFNNECLAHAIFQSRIPIVTGIGHETDLSIADLVADCRGLTPTHAASLVVPDQRQIADDLHELETRLRNEVLQHVERAKNRLRELAGRPSFCRPMQRLLDAEQQLDDWSERLQRAVRLRMQQVQQQLETRAAQLGSLSPLNVLGRGYSLTRMQSDQTVVRSSTQVQPGDHVVTILHYGSLLSRVESISHEPPAASRGGRE